MNLPKPQSRRQALKTMTAGMLVAPVAGMLAGADRRKPAKDKPEKPAKPGKPGKPKPPFNFTPFSVPLPLPLVKQPLAIGAAPFTPGDVFHGIAPSTLTGGWPNVPI
jgi:hypothetical protein